MGRKFEIVTQDEWDRACPHGHRHDYATLQLPKRKTAFSAGYDFLAPFTFVLGAGEDITIPTGIKVQMEQDEFLGIYIRSSLGFNYYAKLANQTGIIDSDYYCNLANDGHIMIKIRNEGMQEFKIEQGKGIAQGIFQKFFLVDGDALEGETRVGGVGSTDEVKVEEVIPEPEVVPVIPVAPVVTKRIPTKKEKEIIKQLYGD